MRNSRSTTCYGIDTTETDLLNDAIEKGEFIPGPDEGTKSSDIGNLLERNGIDVQRRFSSTIDDIVSELSQGHKIPVTLDSDEIWAEISLVEYDLNGWMSFSLILTATENIKLLPMI